MLEDGVDLWKELSIGRSRRVRLRPIRPDDEQALVEMGLRSTPEDLRLRFFSNVRPEIGALTSLLTQFDRDGQIAVAAYDPAATDGDRGILGVVRLILSADKRQGEFAIMVRSDQTGRGLGHALMREMLGWARERRLVRVDAEVMAENKRMLRLAREFGGRVSSKSRDVGTVRVTIELEPADPAAFELEDKPSAPSTGKGAPR